MSDKTALCPKCNKDIPIRSYFHHREICTAGDLDFALFYGITQNEVFKEMDKEKKDMISQQAKPNRLSDLQNSLTPEEIRIIKELRAIPWGKLTVIKKGGAIVMITPAPDILCKQ